MFLHEMVKQILSSSSEGKYADLIYGTSADDKTKA